MTDLLCRDELRRRLVRESAELNGLDYLEVSDDQRQLSVFLLDKVPEDLVKESFRITGGRRVRDIVVTDLDVCRSEDPERDDCITITVDRPGDFSCYRLCVVELDERGRSTGRRRADFDPRYACLDFTFKAGCPTDLDCLPAPCPTASFPDPALDYLAKDFASFRQLILDRVALLVPDRRERHVPDLGITLVELLAYVGDHLSYHQDAVATEAYLDTARLRVSVRRHARLVDYRMHEGCNARAWVSLETEHDQDVELEVPILGLVTSLEGVGQGPVPTVIEVSALDAVSSDRYEWFELMGPAPTVVRAAHSSIRLHTWGDAECCLPAGATHATLLGQLVEDGGGAPTTSGPFLHLGVGDLLLFEEILGPRTGVAADADPHHRHVVRLTEVTPSVDPIDHTPLVEVAWGVADALPFPLCISAVGPAPDCQLLDPISVARGNVVLVDHGRTFDVDLGAVGSIDEQPPCADGCPDPVVRTPARFRPWLPGRPLTYRTPVAIASPARQALVQDPRTASPAVEVSSVRPGAAGSPLRVWTVRADLLASGPGDLDLVVEVDDDGRGQLRFGDGILGRRPQAGEDFSASFRVGNGPAGNIGAGAIRHLVVPSPQGGDPVRLRVSNPIAAMGGVAPEAVAEVKLLAPAAFRHDRQRAVTPGDYAALALRDNPDTVQRAAAELRWTGSWYEVHVAVDALGTSDPSPDTIATVAHRLERFRRIAHDLRVEAAVEVPLDLALTICVGEHHRRSEVIAAVSDRLSNRVREDGTLGLFHPDRLTFGEGVYISRIIAEVAAVAGVDNVVVTRLRRQGELDDSALETGVLRIAMNEIARLDNDRSFPDHGVLTLTPGGGR